MRTASLALPVLFSLQAFGANPQGSSRFAIVPPPAENRQEPLDPRERAEFDAAIRMLGARSFAERNLGTIRLENLFRLHPNARDIELKVMDAEVRARFASARINTLIAIPWSQAEMQMYQGIRNDPGVEDLVKEARQLFPHLTPALLLSVAKTNEEIRAAQTTVYTNRDMNQGDELIGDYKLQSSEVMQLIMLDAGVERPNVSSGDVLRAEYRRNGQWFEFVVDWNGTFRLSRRQDDGISPRLESFKLSELLPKGHSVPDRRDPETTVISVALGITGTLGRPSVALSIFAPEGWRLSGTPENPFGALDTIFGRNQGPENHTISYAQRRLQSRLHGIESPTWDLPNATPQDTVWIQPPSIRQRRTVQCDIR